MGEAMLAEGSPTTAPCPLCGETLPLDADTRQPATHDRCLAVAEKVRADEREAVAALLRSRADEVYDETRIRVTDNRIARHLRDIAERIERGEHRAADREHVLSPDCWCHPTVEEVPGG